jgi:tetratricopeptide (TPR) repeat protein
VSARTLLEESLAIWRALGHRQGIAHPLRELGRLARSEGDYDRAQQQFQQSLALDQKSAIIRAARMHSERWADWPTLGGMGAGSPAVWG